MIITCPDCATRYDIDDARFTPNGRSVRCTACSESWFVPAPEEIDVAPIEDLTPASRVEEKADKPKPKRERSRLKVGIEKTPTTRAKAKKATPKAKLKKAPDVTAVEFDDTGFDDDDNLFDAPLTASKTKEISKKSAAKHDDEPAKTGPRGKAAKDAEPVEKGWRMGRQFIVEDDEEEDRRPFFSRARKTKKETVTQEPSPRSKAAREALRFTDHDGPEIDNDTTDAYSEAADYADEEEYVAGEATIVDADWEDVDEYSDQTRGFGRRVRNERRRATAVARVEDVRRFDPAYFDEEFFASLRVTPRELERAIKKARRRAEYRSKNRMTPLRAFGWSAWAAAVIGSIYTVVAYRDEIVAIAPQTADAYAVIGITANPYGIAIENVRHRLAMSTGGPTIEITGNLSNTSGDLVATPLLQAEALGPRGVLLSRWTFTPIETQITAGGAVKFMTRATAPEGVTEVALSFAPTNTAVSSLLRPRKD